MLTMSRWVPMTMTVTRGRTTTPRTNIGNHQFRATIALAAIVGGGVALLALWWQDTPSIMGLGAWLTNAGRITGLLAGYGLAILLMLMSRAPFLEHGLGADVLARWHAQGGRYTVSLIVAHAMLITWGYAVTAHTNVFTQTGTFTTSYADVLMATVAGVLLVGVGIVSARAARKRLRYETWYYLHLYTYLAVALSFAHQFRDRCRLRRELARPHRVVGVVSPGCGTGGRVPRLATRPTCAATPVADRLRSGRVTRHRLDSHGWAMAPRSTRGVRPVLPLAFRHSRPLVAVTPVLTLGPTGWSEPAHHGESTWRPQPRPATTARRNARACRRSVRRNDDWSAAAAAGALAGRRRWHHATTRAV